VTAGLSDRRSSAEELEDPRRFAGDRDIRGAVLTVEDIDAAAGDL
jgi:hypothetical protein